MYKIDKNFKMPERPQKYPFEKMGVGDSFFVPSEGKDHKRSHILVSAKKHKDKKFTTRKVKSGKVDGFRCWRVE